jgi:hypothetical protein
MMTTNETIHEEVLDRLNRTVIEAAAFFAGADESLFDGRHTAHGVLAQLVFWHEQYVSVAGALIQGRVPILKAGSFERLNQMARSNFAGDSMTMLAYDLSCLQKEFDALVRQLPDWSISFPIKSDSELCPLSERLVEIEQHIRQHVQRLKRFHSGSSSL